MVINFVSSLASIVKFRFSTIVIIRSRSHCFFCVEKKRCIFCAFTSTVFFIGLYFVLFLLWSFILSIHRFFLLFLWACCVDFFSGLRNFYCIKTKEASHRFWLNGRMKKKLDLWNEYKAHSTNIYTYTHSDYRSISMLISWLYRCTVYTLRRVTISNLEYIWQKSQKYGGTE